MCRPAVQVAQKHARRDDVLQVFHVGIGLWDRGVVVQHQQNAGDYQNQESSEGESTQVPGRAELQHALAGLDGEQVQKHVLLHKQRATQIAVAAAAAKNGPPDSVLTHLVNQIVDTVCHGYTLTSCLIAMALERSTNRLPSSFNHMRSQGSGLGAGPSIFTPSLLNLLP